MAIEVKTEKWEANFWIDKKVLDEFKARTMALGYRRYSWIVEQLIIRWLEENK